MSDYVRFTVRLQRGKRAELQRIAQGHGLTPLGGQNYGDEDHGSASRLIQAIADGELGTYDKRTHVVVSKEAFDALQEKAYPYEKD